MIRGTLTEDPGVLEPGDEIITNQGSEMRCYVVEETPQGVDLPAQRRLIRFRSV